VANQGTLIDQCRKPSGWLGRFSLWRMNLSHSRLTDWGLTHVTVGPRDFILDVGCGGGATVGKLAVMAAQGKVYGIDHSEASVPAAKKKNAKLVDNGRVEIQQGSVSHLPYPDNMFDLVTAVETHFWWPDLPADMREISRVVKPGGRTIVIAEIYKGAQTTTARLAEKHLPLTGMTLLTVEEHRELLEQSGYSDVQVIELREKGWICAIGRKPPSASR
jgi:ubiquinone/menaquinone biosynthesis C-methylase UbiE